MTEPKQLAMCTYNPRSSDTVVTRQQCYDLLITAEAGVVNFVRLISMPDLAFERGKF